jgi:hypothetical protein
MMTDGDHGRSRSAHSTAVGEGSPAADRPQPSQDSSAPAGPSFRSGPIRRLRGRGSAPQSPEDTDAVVPSKLAEATIIPFDETFAVIADVDLGTPSPDPIRQLSDDEQKELRADLDEVVRARRHGDLLGASRRR